MSGLIRRAFIEQAFIAGKMAGTQMKTAAEGALTPADGLNPTSDSTGKRSAVHPMHAAADAASNPALDGQTHASRDPLNSGITPNRVNSDGYIIRWTNGEVVGSCRRLTCTGHLVAIDYGTSARDGKVAWCGAACNVCGVEVASPDGRTLPRSSRRNEMPAGAWEKRTKALDAIQPGQYGERQRAA